MIEVKWVQAKKGKVGKGRELKYSETCIRRSPLGPDQLAVIPRWLAYTVCIEINYYKLNASYVTKQHKLQSTWLVSNAYICIYNYMQCSYPLH